MTADLRRKVLYLICLLQWHDSMQLLYEVAIQNGRLEFLEYASIYNRYSLQYMQVHPFNPKTAICFVINHSYPSCGQKSAAREP